MCSQTVENSLSVLRTNVKDVWRVRVCFSQICTIGTAFWKFTTIHGTEVSKVGKWYPIIKDENNFVV